MPFHSRRLSSETGAVALSNGGKGREYQRSHPGVPVSAARSVPEQVSIGL